jgi:hypothetical protein
MSTFNAMSSSAARAFTARLSSGAMATVSPVSLIGAILPPVRFIGQSFCLDH